MARANITVHSLNERNTFADIEMLETALTADGGEVVMNERDDKYLILVHNSATSASDLTVKAGNGIQGTADMVHSVPASSYSMVQLDSGAFKNVTNSDTDSAIKGKVILAGATSLKIAVFKLP